MYKLLGYLKRKDEKKMADNYLKLGIMKNEELANWFGVTIGTYRNNFIHRFLKTGTLQFLQSVEK